MVIIKVISVLGSWFSGCSVFTLFSLVWGSNGLDTLAQLLVHVTAPFRLFLSSILLLWWHFFSRVKLRNDDCFNCFRYFQMGWDSWLLGSIKQAKYEATKEGDLFNNLGNHRQKWWTFAWIKHSNIFSLNNGKRFLINYKNQGRSGYNLSPTVFHKIDHLARLQT